MLLYKIDFLKTEVAKRLFRYIGDKMRTSGYCSHVLFYKNVEINKLPKLIFPCEATYNDLTRASVHQNQSYS